MSKIENILYAAHAQGKREELLKRAGKIRTAPQHKYTEQGEIYEIAWKELAKEGLLSGTYV